MGKKNNPDQNPDPNPEPQHEDTDVLGKFKEIKEEYESKLSDKDKEIAELRKQLEEKDQKVDDTVKDLKDEVTERLRQSEEYKKLQDTVAKLEKDKAEATVDALIQRGIILPVQRDTAVDLCLTQPKTFMNLYENAQPYVKVGEQKSQKVPADKVGQISNYLK